MKQKNAIIGTKVKVKKGEYKGLTGTIVDFGSTSESLLVQFNEHTDLLTHTGKHTCKSTCSYPNSYFMSASELKRIKE